MLSPQNVRGLDLDQFASVALQHADSSAKSPHGHARNHVPWSPERFREYEHFGDESHTSSGPNVVAGVSPSVLGLSTVSWFDEYTNDPGFVESQRELRDLLFTSAQSLAPTRAGTPEVHNSSVANLLQNVGDVDSIKMVVSTKERVVWLKNYLDEVAPWLDMFDASQNFGTAVPVLAQSSTPLVYAMLAISARQMERQKKQSGYHDSLQLYQEAIRSLTPNLLVRNPNVMATCVILCVLEMMSASPWNWRRHLDGCAALLSSHSIHGFSGGLLQAVFWCYARMDLCAAIISGGEESVVLPLENWLPHGQDHDFAAALFRSSGVPDMWANYAVYLASRVCHLMWTETIASRGTEGSDKGEPFAHRWHKLWLELQAWSRDRPPELLPLDFSDSVDESHVDPFPFILYAAPCAISSNQLHHTACLLMLDMRPPSIPLQHVGSLGSKLWHARCVCGISATNEHHGCLNNAIQPLWVAGKLLSHPVEHKAVVDLIALIETKTGWGGRWRINDLKEIWGYDRNVPLE